MTFIGIAVLLVTYRYITFSFNRKLFGQEMYRKGLEAGIYKTKMANISFNTALNRDGDLHTQFVLDVVSNRSNWERE